MRNAAIALLLGGASVAAPAVLESPGTLGPIALVGASVALTAAITESLTSLAIAAGALGALAEVALGREAPLLAGGLWSTAMFLPRLLRAPSTRGVQVGAAVALVTGALATLVSLRHGGADETVVRAAAVLVSAALLGAPFLVSVDAPRTAALVSASAVVKGELGERLTKAAALHRHALRPGSLDGVDETTRQRIDKGWSALADAAQRRTQLALSGASASTLQWLDQRLTAGVDALTRVHAAVDERLARQTSSLQETVEAARVEEDALAAESEAWREIAQLTEAPRPQARA